MIIVLREGAEAEARAGLESAVAAFGAETRRSPGEIRDVLLVAGAGREAEIEAAVRSHPAVERIIPLPAPGVATRRLARRSFLDVFLGVTGGLLLLTCAGVTGLFFANPGRRRTRRDIVPAGTDSDFDRRSYRIVESDAEPILVVRTGLRDYHALSATCTHSEVCQVEWDPRREQIRCPCHRAAFDLFGNVLHGPPPRPLRAYPVAVIEGRVYVRTQA